MYGMMSSWCSSWPVWVCNHRSRPGANLITVISMRLFIFVTVRHRFQYFVALVSLCDCTHCWLVWSLLHSMGLNALQVLRAPALLGSCLSRCTVSCTFVLIRTWQRALRSEVSSSWETGATSPPSYICIHSVSLACASCIGVFSEALRSCMRIRFDCQYAARLEVCVLKFITDRCDLCVRAQCVSCTRQLYYSLMWVATQLHAHTPWLSLCCAPWGLWS